MCILGSFFLTGWNFVTASESMDLLIQHISKLIQYCHQPQQLLLFLSTYALNVCIFDEATLTAIHISVCIVIPQQDELYK